MNVFRFLTFKSDAVAELANACVFFSRLSLSGRSRFESSLGYENLI